MMFVLVDYNWILEQRLLAHNSVFILPKRLWHFLFNINFSIAKEVYTLRSPPHAYTYLDYGYIYIYTVTEIHGLWIYVLWQLSRIRYGWNNLKDCAHACMHDTMNLSNLSPSVHIVSTYQLFCIHHFCISFLLVHYAFSRVCFNFRIYQNSKFIWQILWR